MPNRWMAMAALLLAPLILSGCFIAPGSFVSTLDIAADRSFTFAYKGEVIALDLDESMKGLGDLGEGMRDEEGEAAWTETALLQDAPNPFEDKAEDAEDKADKDRKLRAVADALRKEAGYRSVEYKGEGVFVIDYAISGRLDHGFVYPYNIDAEIVFPFVVIELRGADRVRVKAPAFGDSGQSSGPMGGMGGDSASKAAERLDGTFTLTTDAEIVSQNNEEGAVEANGKRSITWRATPLNKDAPMAVLKLAPLPPAR
ncbi:hypothetical protein ACPVPU_04470 [Sphingomonas sp. CJ99]